MNSIFFNIFLFFRNSGESEGSKERRVDHGRIPDLTVDITHIVSYSQSDFFMSSQKRYIHTETPTQSS
jgi:hypothetical protein